MDTITALPIVSTCPCHPLGGTLTDFFIKAVKYFWIVWSYPFQSVKKITDSKSLSREKCINETTAWMKQENADWVLSALNLVVEWTSHLPPVSEPPTGFNAFGTSQSSKWHTFSLVKTSISNQHLIVTLFKILYFFVQSILRAVDSDESGCINFEEFSIYYLRLRSRIQM